MHLTLIFVIIISYSTVNSHPLSHDLPPPPQPSASDDVESRDDSEAQRPLVQFFKKIFNAFRPNYSSTTESPPTTRMVVPSIYHSSSSLEHFHEIPHFSDYSTYILESFTNDNNAIKFSYINPNITTLRGGDYSVISFLVPHKIMTRSNATATGGSGGILNNFLNFFRFPWRRDPNIPPPGDTVYQQFPSFFEYFAQRVQAYFSIYKYEDESRLNNTIVIEAIEDVHENAVNTDGSVIENDELETTTMDDVENTTL